MQLIISMTINEGEKKEQYMEEIEVMLVVNF
jgi:hypothetical protein